MNKIILLAILALSINAVAQKKHPKVTNETISKKNMLDKRTHPNSEIINFKFADGITGHLVKKDNTWYNYNIRGEKKEVAFNSKEDALQKIWSDAVETQAVGAAVVGGAVIAKKGKLKSYHSTPIYVNGKAVYTY